MAANLFVNRLYVLTESGLVAYDEPFHHGVNIIRGENSSGKSTITCCSMPSVATTPISLPKPVAVRA